MPHASLPLVSLSTCNPRNLKDYAPRLSYVPTRAEMEGQDRVLGRRGALSLSRPSLHFNQGLRCKILLFRDLQLWNLKHPHTLSQPLLHKKKVKKKKKSQ